MPEKENDALSFMDLVDKKFFSPLNGQNNKLLFECINLLINGSEGLGTLYEKDAKRILQEYIEEKQNVIEDDNPDSVEPGWALRKNGSSSDNARQIINRFRDCKWIVANELGQNGESLASVTKYCRKMIEALNRIYEEDTEGAIRNAIFSMYEILKSSIRDKETNRRERPYANILFPLLNLKHDVDDKLSDLNEKITVIAKIANSKSDISEFGEFLYQDEYRETFFAEYEKLNQRGLIASDIDAIRVMLQEFKTDPLYDKAVGELIERKQLDEVEAEAYANRVYDEIFRFISTGYDWEISRLNMKINANYRLYTRKIEMLAGDENNTQKKTREFMDALINMNEKDTAKALSHLSENTVNIYKLEMMDFDSVRRKGHTKKDHSDITMPIESLTEEERATGKAQMLSTVREPYSLRYARKYFDRLIPETAQLTMDEFNADTEDDILMLTSAMLYQGTREFGYTIEVKEGETDKGKVKIKNMVIRRLDNGRDT